MSLSPLPLSYCTNVHAGRSVAEVEQGLQEHTVALRNLCSPDRIAPGLWLAQSVVQELLQAPDLLTKFTANLREWGLECYTLNAFPYGDFHSPRVKEKVYLPDWSQPERLEYTWNCAQILTRFLPEGREGSISTLPLGFKGFALSLSFEDRCCEQLYELTRRLDRLHQETGRLIRLAIEPEPFCVLETTTEACGFFAKLFAGARDSAFLDLVRRHIGLCYDVCHQAVEFEDISGSIAQLQAAEVRINKLHMTCALQLDHPADHPEARDALARYVEPRYLHQTIARTRSGAKVRVADLSRELSLTPPGEFLDAETWRIHFHVPLNAEKLGPLSTTRPQLAEVVSAVAALDYAPHLEVETYTWEVLPESAATKQDSLAAGLALEAKAAWALIKAV